MTKKEGKKKINPILILPIGVIVFVFATFFISGFNHFSKKKEERKAKEELIQIKKDYLDSYMESIVEFTGERDFEDSLKLFEISSEAYSATQDISLSGRYSDGDEYLEKVAEIALNNMDDAIEHLLTDDEDGERFSRLGSDIPHKELLSLNNRASIWGAENERKERAERYREEMKSDAQREEERAREAEARDRAEGWELLKSSIQTSMSESTVKKILGSPSNTFRTEEAYFWVYGDLVLTMKNGFVYDVARTD